MARRPPFAPTWDVNKLTPLQLRMLYRAMAQRKNKDLGALELAGLLQADTSFTPVDVMRSGDVSAKMRTDSPRRTTRGIHWETPRIAMNTAFPGSYGGTFGHELTHEALSRAGITGKDRGHRQHELMKPYLMEAYRRAGSTRQLGPDVSRSVGPHQDARAANPGLLWNDPIPKPYRAHQRHLIRDADIFGIEKSMAESAEGRRRRDWWNRNRGALMRRMASATGGRGR